MKLTEAASAIGRQVVYTPLHGARELGVIVRVNEHYVFVRYSAWGSAIATAPSLLAFDIDPAASTPAAT